MCNPVLAKILRSAADAIEYGEEEDEPVQRGRRMLDEPPPAGRGQVNMPRAYGPVPNEGTGMRSIIP